MTSSKLCTVALFIKDTENVKKNYCKTEVEPNSILCRGYHIIDGLCFIASQNIHIHCSLSSETKRIMIVNPSLGIIKLSMSCTATSSYLTL